MSSRNAWPCKETTTLVFNNSFLLVLFKFHFIDFVFTFGLSSNVTLTLHETVTVACEILCCTVGCVSTSATPSICPSHSLDSSSWMLIGRPTAWWTNFAISCAFCLALWTANRLACCLQYKIKHHLLNKCFCSVDLFKGLIR